MRPLFHNCPRCGAEPGRQCWNVVRNAFGEPVRILNPHPERLAR